MTIKGNIEIFYEDDSNVFVAGNLLGHPEIRQAPDGIVVCGQPNGDQGSSPQFREGNIAPQVVFAIRAPGKIAVEIDPDSDEGM